MSVFVLFRHPASYGLHALKVINRVGQVGALRVVEVDDVILYRNGDVGARRLDLVVAGNIDGALGHLGAERLAVDGLGLVQDLVRALLQVVHRVGQVGALRVVEVDDVILYRNGDVGARRLDLVVAGNIDGALGHLGAERLAVDGLGLVQDLVRALLQVVHRVGQIGALLVHDIEDVTLHLNDEALRGDDTSLVPSRALRVNGGLVQGHRIPERLLVDHHGFVDLIFFCDGVPVVINGI